MPPTLRGALALLLLAVGAGTSRALSDGKGKSTRWLLPPANRRLMPLVGNGYLGTVLGSDTVLIAGVYVHEVEWLSALCSQVREGEVRPQSYQLVGRCGGAAAEATKHPRVVPGGGVGSRRARVPAPHAVTEGAGSSLVGLVVDYSNGAVLRKATFPGTQTELTLRWYAHRTRRGILVMEAYVNNSLGTAPFSAPLEVPSVEPSADIAFRDDHRGSAPVDGARYGSDVRVQEGLVVKAESAAANCTRVGMAWRPVPASLPSVAPGANAYFTYVAAIRTDLEGDVHGGAAGSVAGAARNDLAAAEAAAKAGTLAAEHEAAWAELWRHAVEVSHPGGSSELGEQVRASQYELFSNVRDDWDWPASPGGLATNGYMGQAFWDSETWMMAAVLPFHPELAAPQLRYRAARASPARALAAARGWRGCMFPWQSGATGGEVDLFEWANRLEQHVTGDVALGLRAYWRATRDVQWLDSVGIPLAACIADFWTSRLVPVPEGDPLRQRLAASTNATAAAGQTPALYSVRKVVPPDEFAVGFPRYTGVDDNPWTNMVAQHSLLFAADAVGNSSAPPVSPAAAARWRELAAGVVLPRDPDTNVAPEYTGFPAGNRWAGGKVKQADVTLLAFPGDDPSVSLRERQADLEFYEPLYDRDGPAMTWAVSAVAWLDLARSSVPGAAVKAAERLNATVRNVQPPFNVWTETPNPAVHPADVGATHFATGAGGLVQAAVHGLAGLRVRDDRLDVAPYALDPTLVAPGNATPATPLAVTLRGLRYLGSTLTVEATAEGTAVTLDASEGDAPAIELVWQEREEADDSGHGGGSSVRRPLVLGEMLRLPPWTAFAVRSVAPGARRSPSGFAAARRAHL